MKAKMTNQRYTSGKWITTYITDIPVKTPTIDTLEEIKVFCKRQFSGKTEDNYTISISEKNIEIERNCMLGFWQFTVLSSYEINKFDVNEESEDYCV